MKLENPSDSAQELPSLYEAVITVDPILDQPKPPDDLMKFRTLSPFDKAKSGTEFFHKEHIEKYLDTKWKRELHNRSNYLWLIDLKKIITDSGKLERINARIKEFGDVIRETRNPYKALQVVL